ncbi:MAG: DNA polymerase III subunit delta [Deltaproteobacteria bacterium]|nr:DNA polymerase III subunit delta [Deltaproteobacteria bacterium]
MLDSLLLFTAGTRYTIAAMAEKRTLTSFPRPEEVLAQLDKAQSAPLYLFHGEEPYLIEQAVERVRRRVGKGMTAQTFFVGEDSLDRVLETWGTPSLFAPASLVILKRAEGLKAADRECLEREAELRDASQPLVVCAQGRVDVAQKFFERCAKVGFVAEFRPPFANQVPIWAQRFARERKVSLTEEAATLLADLVGTDLFALANEIDKLIAFVMPKTDIDVDAVTACVGQLPTSTVFDLADALGRRDRQKALALLRQVLVDEREALPVLQALVGHFRRLWRVKELLTSGAPEIQIERTTGLRGMRLRAMLSQCRLFSVADLHRLFRQAAEMDVTFKSSRLSPAALFDALILMMSVRSP